MFKISDWKIRVICDKIKIKVDKHKNRNQNKVFLLWKILFKDSGRSSCLLECVSQKS